MKRCEEHGVSLPCAGCRADRLAADRPLPRLPAGYVDHALLAAGDRREEE